MKNIKGNVYRSVENKEATPEKDKEELEIVENVNKSCIDILKEEIAVKSKLEEKFEIAKNMLKTLINIKDGDIVAITGLSIS